MKIFVFILIVFSVSSCNTFSPEFIKSSQQEWSINSKNSSGTVYHIVLKAKTDSSLLKIDSIAVGNKIIKTFKYSVLGKSNISKDFEKGDSILVSFNLVDNEKYNFYNHENCVFVRVKNKNKRVKIESLLKLPSIIND